MIAATLDLRDSARQTWDVLVIGAGPGGSTTAREAARRGARVLLVDRCDFPRPKVCGCCLNRRTIHALERMGLSMVLEHQSAVPLHNMQLAVDRRRAMLRLPGGAAVSRTGFDAALVDAAVDSGAAFLPRTVATLESVNGATRQVKLQRNELNVTVSAAVVVAASGLGDRLATRNADIVPRVARDSHVGAGVIVDEGPAEYASGTIYMSVGRDGYVGVVRLEDGRLDVAAALRPSSIKRRGGMGRVAHAILCGADMPRIAGIQCLPWRGTPGLTRRPSRVAAERLFLVGDAAGYVEPFTGEGIACALDCAQAVTPILVRGIGQWDAGLERRWSDLHGRIVRKRLLLCRTTSALLRRRVLSRALVNALASAPALADPFVRWLNRSPYGAGST